MCACKKNVKKLKRAVFLGNMKAFLYFLGGERHLFKDLGFLTFVAIYLI